MKVKVFSYKRLKSKFCEKSSGTMASLFEYEKEAIRIKARRVDRGQEEQRKFSVDPNITSFEVWYC